MGDCEIILSAYSPSQWNKEKYNVHIKPQRQNGELDNKLLTVTFIPTMLSGKDVKFIHDVWRRHHEFTATNVSRIEFRKMTTLPEVALMYLWTYNFDKGREEQITHNYVYLPMSLRFSMRDLAMSRGESTGENRWETCLKWNFELIVRDPDIYGDDKYYLATNPNWHPPINFRRITVDDPDDNEPNTYNSGNPYLTKC